MTEEVEKAVSRAINERSVALAEDITARRYESYPEVVEHTGAAGRTRCLEDAEVHLSYLSESIAAAQPTLFADYIAWAKVMLEGRGICASEIARYLENMRASLRSMLPVEMSGVASEYVELGLRHLSQLPSDLPTCIGEANPFSELANTYLNALLRGERRIASRLIMQAIEDGVGVKEIYLFVLQRCQHEVGRLWQLNLLSVAQEHYCTAATQHIMSQLSPRIFAAEQNGRTLIATCVAGDQHEVGVRMVSDFFEMEGWNTFYLGANVPAASILEVLDERGADVLAVSATMTPHVSAVEELIDAVRSKSNGRSPKILVGGYPFNIAPELWQRVGADAYARDALEGVAIIERLAA